MGRPRSQPQDDAAITRALRTDSEALRYAEWWDGDTDMWKSRFDVVFGVLLQRGEHAIAVYAE